MCRPDLYPNWPKIVDLEPPGTIQGEHCESPKVVNNLCESPRDAGRICNKPDTDGGLAYCSYGIGKNACAYCSCGLHTCAAYGPEYMLDSRHLYKRCPASDKSFLYKQDCKKCCRKVSPQIPALPPPAPPLLTLLRRRCHNRRRRRGRHRQFHHGCRRCRTWMRQPPSLTWS